MAKRLINTIKQRSKRYINYKYNYSPRNNNQFQLYSEGKQFFPAMLDAIKQANSSVYIIQYIFETSLTANLFIKALIQARQNNVAVYLILDAYGSKGLSIQQRQQLLNAGVQLYLFNPLRNHHLLKYLYRDHRKLLVIDKSTAFLGGAGICDDYNFPEEHDKSWRDIMLQINGSIVQDCASLFKQHMPGMQGQNLTRHNRIKASHLLLHKQQARLLSSCTWHHNEIQRAIIHAAKKTRKRIWITTPYFVPTRRLKKSLIAAALRGCDVRLLLPGKNSDHPWVNQVARHLYNRLLKNKIKIYEYQPRFTHAKAILCDDWVCIGSSNLDKWNQKFNLELNIEVQSPDLTLQLSDFFEAGFNDAIHISPLLWNNRPALQRIKEWFWSKLAMWLERLVHNMR